MYKFLDLVHQNNLVRKDIDEVIERNLDSGTFIGGEDIEQFEEAFSKFIGAKHCIGVANGTDALEISIEALGLPKGSEIIVPVNSFIATSEAVERNGHKVVFADVLEKNATIDPLSVDEKITKNTAAIIVVHLYGHPCSMTEITTLCDKYKLHLIEDCAQSHGAMINGKMTGTFGVIAAYSFYPGKNLGGIGDGGAIVTNDENLAKTSRMISQHGRAKSEKYVHEIIGRNSRLDAINAAVLNIKLKRLPEWLELRNSLAKTYINYLDGSKAKTLEVDQGSYHSYHLFVCKCEDRDGLREYLNKEGVGTGIHYPIPLNKQPAYSSKMTFECFPVANYLASVSLSLPIGEHLNNRDIKIISDIIKNF